MPNARGLHRCLASEILVDGKPACALNIPHRLLCCPRHWGMVPQDVQRQLWRAYRRAPSGDGRAVVTKQYLAAVDRCREELRIKLDGIISSQHLPLPTQGDRDETDEARRQ